MAEITVGPSGITDVSHGVPGALPGKHANHHVPGGTDVIPDATIEKSGLMPPEDKEKIDDVYTKSEVYTKKEVDDKLGIAGYGDMMKSTYDTDNDGKVDMANDSEAVGGKSFTDIQNDTVQQISTHNDNKASTSIYGHAKLYNGVDSESMELAATANSVKTAYDKLISVTETIYDASGINEYEVIIDDVVNLNKGLTRKIAFANANNDDCTLQINDLAAKSLILPGGLRPNIKKAVYTVVYDGTNFQLQSEGASGNAVSSDLRSGKTATTDDGVITGTLDLSLLVPGNIRKNITIDDVAGILVPVTTMPENIKPIFLQGVNYENIEPYGTPGGNVIMSDITPDNPVIRTKFGWKDHDSYGTWISENKIDFEDYGYLHIKYNSERAETNPVDGNLYITLCNNKSDEKDVYIKRYTREATPNKYYFGYLNISDIEDEYYLKIFVGSNSNSTSYNGIITILGLWLAYNNSNPF